MNKDLISLETVLSPSVQENILNYNYKNTEIIKIFNNFIKFYNRENHVVSLYLPKEFITIFKSNKVLNEMVFNRIVSNSKILFKTMDKKTCCTKVQLEENELSKIYGYNEIYKNNIPIFVGVEDIKRLKSCNTECENENEFCHSIKSFLEKNIENVEFKEAYKEVYNQWFFSKENLQLENIKKFIKIIGIFYSENYEIEKLDRVEIVDEFIEEIKKEDSTQIKKILSSIARSIFFESTSKVKEIKDGQIDYHRHDLKKDRVNKYKGYDIYRLDCVNLHENGIGTTSGIERIIFVVKKGNEKIYFLHYTSNHDVEDSVIKKRIDKLSAIV